MKSITLSSLFLGAAASLLAIFSTGCADGGACDADNMVRDRNFCVCAEGYSLVGRECVKDVEPTPGAEGGAGGADDMMTGSGGSEGPSTPVAPDEFFGVVCTVGEDADTCGGDAPTCAAAPGKTEGVCSVLGCKSDPDSVVCPIGWSCFSLGDVCTAD